MPRIRSLGLASFLLLSLHGAVPGPARAADRDSLRRAPANRAPRVLCSLGTEAPVTVGAELRFELLVDDPERGRVDLVLLDPPPGLVFAPLRGVRSPAVATGRWLVPSGTPERVLLHFRAQDGDGGRSDFQVALFPRRREGATILTGDVTGDGIDDVVAAAPYADVGGAINAGSLHVWEGGTALDELPTATLLLGSPSTNDRLGSADEGGVQLVDVDLDGTLDVLACVPGADENGPDAGGIWVWFGGSALQGTRTPDAGFVPDSPQPGERLGRTAPLLADVTGDGLDDLIAWSSLAEPTGQTDMGAIWIWEGGNFFGGNVPPTSTLLRLSSAPGDQLGQASGQGVLVGDVTGDSVLDIVAGAWSADLGGNANVGLICVWAGGSNLVGSLDPDWTLEAPFAQAGDQLGRAAGQAIQLVDLNGDAQLDVLAAAQFADASGVQDSGAVYVWFGGSGLDDAVDATLLSPDPFAGDQLGLASGQGVVVADVTGDALLDVIVGSMLADTNGVNAGALYVWSGPLSSPQPHVLASALEPGDQLGLSGGLGIQVGDVTGDSRLDVVVGAMLADGWGLEPDTGAVLVWQGSSALQGSGTDYPIAELRADSPHAGDQIGNAKGQGVQLFDLNADGTLDVVVTAPLADVGGAANAGAILVFAGGVDLGLPPTTLSIPGTVTGDRLGEAGDQGVLFADLTGDGLADLVAGAVEADQQGIVNSGGIWIWQGGSSFASTPLATLWTGSPDANARLGSVSGRSIRFADLTDDGILDLVSGTPGADDLGPDAGALYLWEGSSSLSGLTFPQTLYVFTAQPNDQLGRASVGIQFADLTGNAVPDLLAGAELADVDGVTNAGALYVWYGSSAPSGADVRLSVPGAQAGDRLGAP